MTRFLHISSAVAGSVAVACIAFAGAVPGAASAAGRTPAAAAVQVAAVRVTLPAYVPARRTLEYGMHGNDVRALQQRLAQLEYYPGAADGQFGADTLEAVTTLRCTTHPSATTVASRNWLISATRVPSLRFPLGRGDRT